MSTGDRYALIVASYTHTDPRLSRLRAPAVDAEELARVLTDPDIGAFTVATTLNESEHVVLRRLSAFFDDRRPDDLLMLHLSCHGVKDEDGRLYFATSDTEVEQMVSDAETHADEETADFSHALLQGRGLHHVSIVGPGRIDGNRRSRGGPKPIALKQCRDVTISNLTLENAPNYNISLLGCEHVDYGATGSVGCE